MLTIAIILGAMAIMATVVWAIINFKEIVDWFKRKSYLKNPEDIAFTLKTKMAAGDYEIVTGIFDPQQETVKTGEVIRSKQMDAEIRNQKELVIYH